MLIQRLNKFLVVSHDRLFKYMLTVVGLSIVLLSNLAGAWHIDMHARMAQIAHAALPDHIREPLSPYVAELMQGAKEPDMNILDLPNHFLNIHVSSGTPRLAQLKIESLYYAIENQLTQPNLDLSQIAFQLGYLSHYLADINQPLHTDEYPGEMLMHLEYEEDIWKNMEEIILYDPGVRYRLSPSEEALSSALHANMFYNKILSAYMKGQGLQDILNISHLNIQRALEDIRDTWTTLWELSQSNIPKISLSTNKIQYTRDDTIKVVLSMVVNKFTLHKQADIYVLLINSNNNYYFLDNSLKFMDKPVCYQCNIPLKSFNKEIINTEVPLQSLSGKYQFYALLLKPGMDLMDKDNWISNLAYTDISILE